MPPLMQLSLKSWALRAPLITSVLLGTSFGVCFRLFALAQRLGVPPNASMLMTVAYLALGQFAIGLITVHAAERAEPRSVWGWIWMPWPAVLLTAGLAYLVNLEGWICIVMALPIALVLASAGGIAAGWIARSRRGRRRLPLACVALIPLLLAPLESRVTSPVEHRTVATEISIHAPEALVWRNIERVRPIAPSELRRTWAHTIGFPRPVEATLSYEGAGGVRHASFERGVMFIETITRWEPEKVLAFSINADTASIPKTTLDEHVTIGGRYFDVLDGEYRLEQRGDGNILLHLSSRERLSTDFNGYAGLWSDAVMSTLQTSILEVIKARCETGSR